MKVIIAGGRNFNDYHKLSYSCNIILKDLENIEIVSGTANGADKLGEKYASQMNYPIIQFPANWNLYGRSAGYRRNSEMADYADMLIAFWDGNSRGTKHMIDLATSKGLKVNIIHY